MQEEVYVDWLPTVAARWSRTKEDTRTRKKNRGYLIKNASFSPVYRVLNRFGYPNCDPVKVFAVSVDFITYKIIFDKTTRTCHLYIV